MTRAIEAIILAAGSSARLGRPKALLDLDGVPLLARVRDVLVEAGVARGVVVLGQHEEAVREACDPTPFTIVRNLSPEAGRTGSLQCGLEAVATGADVVLWPIDRPFAATSTVQALLAARKRAGPAGWIVPAHEGHAGHPLILRAGIRAAIRAAPADESLRVLLERTGRARRVVPVDDPGILRNVDTEADWTDALAWWWSRLR